ncbi:hypothetical protein E2C01_093743 [Portunus trituberculatus]|uniref:Uncharacterized protein n=1 Tax=Portunus trituberculatus TaxID=210409 RepID=A0A5B7JV05_PORTR|nr:hypothetical protein [Portunus trituberculatus]
MRGAGCGASWSSARCFAPSGKPPLKSERHLKIRWSLQSTRLEDHSAHNPVTHARVEWRNCDAEILIHTILTSSLQRCRGLSSLSHVMPSFTASWKKH